MVGRAVKRASPAAMRTVLPASPLAELRRQRAAITAVPTALRRSCTPAIHGTSRGR
jgi:hypothetical protein